MKILVTGGSGFIGTNLISYLTQFEFNEILSLDIAEPKIELHRNIWEKIDLRDKAYLF